MKKENEKRNILHVTHCWGGGIPIYLDDMKQILKDDYNIFILKCMDGHIELEYGESNQKKSYYYSSEKLCMTEISNQAYKKIVNLILKAFEIELIHINITLGHTFDIFKIPKKHGIPVIYTVHDYFYICPTFHLIDRNGKYCRVCDYGNENSECLEEHPYINNPEFDNTRLLKWRSEFLKVRKFIDYFIFPSFSCKKIFTSFYKINDHKCSVIYHGTSVKSNKQAIIRKSKKLRVGIIGSLFKHKGESIVNYILKHINDNAIKFYHFGEGFLESFNLVNLGAYERNDIVDLLCKHKIDITIFTSIWPETFSYTLTESIAAGIPPIVTNLGSLQERVENGKIGWVVEHNKPRKFCDLIRYLKNNKSEIEEKRNRIKKFHLKTLDEMKTEYIKIYNPILNKNMDKDLSEKESALKKLKEVEVIEAENSVNDMARKGPLEIFFSSMEKK